VENEKKQNIEKRKGKLKEKQTETKKLKENYK